MDNQLVKVFVINCLTHLCLSASISTAPSTTPACFPGSSRVNECMSYYCDENGQWQEFEFTPTHECCLKSSHPACAEWGMTYSEFISTSTSPSTTSSSPACNSGWMKTKDCRIFFCQDGQWQVGEFTATKECCLQNFNPKCGAMGLTSTDFISITESPSTSPSIPTCDMGSMTVKDCRMFFCLDGRWQVGEFTATKECCLQEFHPKCVAMGFTSTEFTPTTEAPPTTTSSPACASGLTTSKDCRLFFCQDGQWQVGEFTATKECCLKELHPKCRAMGFTSTGQTTGFTSTEFISTTESQRTTSSTPMCDSSSMKAQDCRIFFCQDGQWQVGEFTATKECCLQEFHPKCKEMGFTSTELISSTIAPTTPTPACEFGSGRVQDCTIYICMNGEWEQFEFTATQECCLKEYHPMCKEMGFTSTGKEMGFTSTGQTTGFTSTEFISTTESPRTSSSTPECGSGSMKAQECRIFFCQDGQWQVGEFTATKECCLKLFHPKCKEMGFTSTELISTTILPTTLTPACADGDSRKQDCTIHVCLNGEWQQFEFTPTQECCLQEFHPMCIIMGFTELASATTSPTTITTAHACTEGTKRKQDCRIYLCVNAEWQVVDFTVTQSCCLKEFHTICEHMGFTSPVSSSSTTSPNSDCSPGSSRVQDCGVYLCENGQWQLFEFFSSDECCEKENHPKCAELGTAPPDDSSPKDWPLTDSDSSERLDILLIRLPLLPDLPFPVAYKYGGRFNSHEDTSDGPKNSNHAVYHRE